MNFKSEEKEPERDRQRKKQRGRERQREEKKILLGIYALRKLKTKKIKIKNQIRRAAENQRKTRKSIHLHENYHVICKQ